MSSLCQICGARFYDDDLFSNPLSHFCIGLDGPAIVHFDAEEEQISAPHTPEFEKRKNAPQPKALALPAQAHAQEDLDEIAKLHREVDALKAKLKRGHVSFA
ncbi:hypothetical protein CERZMDRAFT_113616 [Cercospora zeae-maydis SCOH1-5]|uniref:Uncharacterized protein n=1 Tax=Cercospora zeae-maydis SCOH1-5 TaxID=717836 RepID=A0A6A6F919_9PEZI|nr:hypothetical protein CERZMDRAFT_113616 [Cercospora zeae-maydis SCOH1-5]